MASQWRIDRIHAAVAGAEHLFNQEDINQYQVVFDMISEGEIEGLVDGPASVFLNDTPLIDKNTLGEQGPKTTKKASMDITSNSAQRVTVSASENFFDNRTISTTRLQYCRLAGAGKSSTSASVTFAGTAAMDGSGAPYTQSTITASGSFFATDGSMNTANTEINVPFKIEGAGMDGRPWYGHIVSVTNATTAIVTPAFSTTVTAATGALDHVSKVTAIDSDNDYCTLETAALTSVTNANFQLFYKVDSTYNFTNDNRDWNFDSAASSFLTGTMDQPAQTNFGAHVPTVSYMYSPNIEMKQNSDYKSGGTGFEGGERFAGTASDTVITSSNIGASTPSSIDQIKLTFDFPQGLYSIDTYDGDEGPNWVELQIYFEYQRTSGSSWTSEIAFGRESLNGEDPDAFGWAGPHIPKSNAFIVSDKDKTPFSEEFLIDATPYQPFNDFRIRVKKVNADNFRKGKEDWTMYGITILKMVEAQITDRLSYPGTAYAVTSFDAKDFPSPPMRKYHAKGLKIQVPTNYITRDEAGSDTARYERNITSGIDTGTYQDWDGNFRGDVSTFSYDSENYNKVYCNNPAWIFYDLCTNPVYGLGSVIKDTSVIDKYALYKIARYCDEMVPDGKGGTEPRFTCNTYISQQADAYKVLMDIAQVFRGMLYWMNGQLTAVQDRPKSPSYTFNQSNVIEGAFNYQGTSDKQRHNQVIVGWNNPNNKFIGETVAVEDVEDITEKGVIKKKSISAFGCTSEGQARRLAEWAMLTNKLENEIISFETSINANFLRPGDIINVQDSDRNKVQFSGRVSGTGTLDKFNIPLDRSITLYPDSTYTCHIIFAEEGAFLGQDSATISGTKYFRDDLVLTDETGADINTELKSLNVKDDDNEPVRLEWTEGSRVEKQLVAFSQLSGTPDATTGAKTVDSLNLIQGYSDTPAVEAIWALTSDENDGDETKDTRNAKQYRIISVAEDSDDHTYAISALLYDINKFEKIEKGYSVYVPPYKLEPDRLKILPKPRSASISFSRGGDFSGEGKVNYQIANISWAQPEEAVKNDKNPATLLATALTPGATSIVCKNAGDLGTSGTLRIGEEAITWTGKSTNTLTGCTRGAYATTPSSHSVGEPLWTCSIIPHRDIAHYEVKHNLKNISTNAGQDGNLITVHGTHLEVINPNYGYYHINIRSVSKTGQKSAWYTFKGKNKLQSIAPLGRKEKIARGGHMTGNFLLNETTGNINTAADNYTFTNNKGKLHEVTSATTAQEIQAFSGLSDSNIGYLVHDSSDTTDPWKAIDLYTDYTLLSPIQSDANTLAEALDATETEIDITDASNFGDSGVITVGSEQIIYTGKSTNTLTGCTRGSSGTTAATHSNGATVYFGQTPFSYWKEVGASNNGLTLGSGTVTIEVNRRKVTGSSTNFDGDFVVGDLVRFASTNDYALKTDAVYGIVQHIISDTEMYLKEASPRAFSAGSYCYKQSWKPDFEADTLIAKITRNSSTSYTMNEKYATTTEADAYTITITNDAKTLPTTTGGTVTYTDSGTTISVYKGTKQLQAVATGTTPTFDQFRVVNGDITDTNITKGSQSISGKNLVFGNASSISSDQASITYPIDIESIITVSKTQTFAKANQGATGATGNTGASGSSGSDGVRGYSIFTIEESSDSNVSAANVLSWVGDTTFDDSNANDIAGAVIALAADNYIRPNDRITVTDNSASKAGTRIYEGSATGTEGDADASNFSSLVTESFDGSVIVDGTLAAAKLTSDFVYTKAMTVGSSNNVFKVNTDGDIWSGHATEGSAPFQVNNTGALTATSATITGAITATSGAIGGWTVDSNSMYSGTKDTTGYTSTNGHITISSGGGIHTPKFYVDSSGNAGFSGTVTIGTSGGDVNLDETNTLNENTTKANVGLSNVDNDSTSTIRAVGAATSGTVGGWTISASTISGTNITIDNTNARILVED